MPKIVVPPPTLAELRQRGNKAVSEGVEAIRNLRRVVREAEEIRERIDCLHHRKPVPSLNFVGLLRVAAESVG